MTRDEIAKLILDERARHFNLPGHEYDVTNTPNDWIAIILSYCSENAKKNQIKPDCDEYSDSLIKAAAVIVAALEHLDMMTTKGHFRDATG